MPPDAPTVLVVDDDDTVRDVLARYLSSAGLRVVTAADGGQALVRDAADDPDLVVLDLMLPVLTGDEVFRRLRQRRGHLPVIMLTARGDESDRLLGLEMGADDYVTKPFSNRELVLRVQSVLRRAGSVSAAGEAVVATSELTDGDLALDRVAHVLRRSGVEVPLTIREFDLLAHLMSHPGQAFTRAAIMREVWGWEHGDEATITVHVRRLREKVETDPSRPTRLLTVWGVGYRWQPRALSAPQG